MTNEPKHGLTPTPWKIAVSSETLIVFDKLNQKLFTDLPCE